MLLHNTQFLYIPQYLFIIFLLIKMFIAKRALNFEMVIEACIIYYIQAHIIMPFPHPQFLI